jgi:ABC-type amino acid transport substrate-binding protein
MVAADLGWQYEFREFALPALRNALKEKTIDVGIGAIPVTSENDEICDFSQPYLNTGTGLAQRATDPLTMRSVVGILLDPRLLSMLGIIAIAVVAVGVVIALVERRSHTPDFGGPLSEGVSTGVWWAAVTMTTVGYGDATPRTGTGRFLALLWMFIGVVVVALLTATVTSMITVNHLRGVVQQPADLLRLRIGIVAGGAAQDFLDRRNTKYSTYDSCEKALEALDQKRIDAVVANLPSLRYLVRRNWQGILEVSPLILEPESFAIALPENSQLRKPLDSAVIRARQGEHWRDTVHAHLGSF